MITITFPDGNTQTFSKGSTPLDIAASLSEGLARAVVGAKINDTVVDATVPITVDATIELLTPTSEQGLEIVRHSMAHLLAHAVSRLYPQAIPTIGPVIENGFYYDFDKLEIKEEDLGAIEQEMKKIIKEKHPVTRNEYANKKETLEANKNNSYKTELIKEFTDETSSSYTQGEFTDLCRGPHIPNTGSLKHVGFALDKLAGAYWRGDAKNPMLTRIYGLAFADKKLLQTYLENRALAEERDHKKIGKEMQLYAQFDKIGKGLPVWLPKGNIIKEAIESFAKEKEERAGFVRVSTPNLAKKELFLTSGHLPYYEDDMYPCMKMDDGDYYLKAMNCPLHHLIFDHTPKSYKDMPLRIAEYGTCYRNELSGALNGLQRVRMLSMNDAHIYCTKEQIKTEITAVLRMIKEYYAVFDLQEYWFRLSLGDVNNTKKYIDQPENWRYSENILREVLVEMKLPFKECADEAAFYGPKIDVQFRNVYGKEDSMSTVQLDFIAKERFHLHYIDESGKKNNEVFVIHRAPLSTHERFMAFVIEHFAGKFPLWMAPVQARILPVSDKHIPYANEVMQEMQSVGLRVEVETKTETINKKVREAQLDRINYILVVGDKECADKTVTVRTRDEKVHGAQKIATLTAQLQQESKNRELPTY